MDSELNSTFQRGKKNKLLLRTLSKAQTKNELFGIIPAETPTFHWPFAHLLNCTSVRLIAIEIDLAAAKSCIIIQKKTILLQKQ